MRNFAALPLLLLLAAPGLARAEGELDDLKKQYAQLDPDEKAFWAFLDQVAREERDLIALMGRAREAEEVAARSPQDKELRQQADALSSETKRQAEERDKRLPEYNKRYGTHMGKIKGLFQKVDALWKKDPKNDDVGVFRLKILADQGAVGEVRDEAERLFQARPDDADVRLAWGECQMVVPSRAGNVPPRFEKAFEVLEPLAKAQTTNGEVQLLYGVAASAVDKNEAAKAAFETIASIGSLRPAVRLLIGNPQDPNEAYMVWREAAVGLAKDPADWKLRKKRVQLLYFVNADERVVEDAKLALKEKPDDAALRKLLVGSYTRMRKWEEARPVYEQLAPEMAKDDELRAQYAIFLFNTDKKAEALGELVKVRDLSSLPGQLQQVIRGILGELSKKKTDDPQILGFRLRSAADQGAFTAIWDDVEGLFHQFPDDPVIRFVYAECCMCVPVPAHDPRDRRPPVEPRRPRFEKAYELLEPLLKAEPANPDYLLLHGVAACALGKDAEAKKDFDGIASIESCRPAVRTLLGSARDPGQQYRRWRDIANGLAEKPGDPDSLKKRAEFLTLCEAFPLAIRDAEAALKAKPDDKILRATLGRANMQLNHFEKALEAFGDAPIDEAKHARLACVFFSNRIPEFFAGLEKLDEKERLGFLRPLGGSANFVDSAEKRADMAKKWEEEEKARAADAKRDDNPRVQLETTKGIIVIELFEDTAPNTVANFVWLAEGGFYDGIKFHRVIPGFMAQGGDPTGTGAGGPGYDIKDELKGNTRYHWRGTLSMAKTAAPNSGNSQFFMNYVPTPHLNDRHTVFGRIIDGQAVADELANGDAIKKATVLRKRAHEYKPETIPSPGKTPWKPKEK